MGVQLVQSGNNGTVFAARGPAWLVLVTVRFGLLLQQHWLQQLPQISANGQISLGYQGNSPSRNGSATGRATRGADIVTPDTHDIFFTNGNSYPVTLNSNSTGGARAFPSGSEIQVQNDGSSSSYRIAANRQAISLGTVTWTARANRPSADFPLQEDILNFSINAGGANIDFGTLPGDDTIQTVTSAGGEVATSGTYSGQIFDTELTTFNRTTANAATTTEGSVTITRSDGGTRTSSQSTSTTATSGTANPGTGQGGYANNHNWNTSATRLTFPANTTVDQTINYTWSYTGITWMYLNTQREWRIQGTGQSTLTIGGQTYRNTTGRWQPSSGQSFYFNESGVSGVWGHFAHRLFWSETAGSGLNIQLNGANAPEYNGPGAPSLPTGNSQALLNNANRYPQLVDSLLAVANDFNFPANPVDGQIFSVPPQTTNGTIRIHGTTGGSGSTLRMYFGEVVSNSLRTGWAPRNIGTVSGNQSTTVQLYDYAARVAAGQGPAAITGVSGNSGGTFTARDPLTTSDQIFLDGTDSATIGVQGNYTVVSGTSNDQGARGVTLTQAGNGVYGPPDADAPNVNLQFMHTGTNAFTVDVPAFNDGDDTTEEYRDYLLATLPGITEFSGLDPFNPDNVGNQPAGAVFYVSQSPDNANAVRFANVLADDHEPVSITAETILNGITYPETQFGGNIMQGVVTTNQGAADATAPIVRVQHSSDGGMGDFDVRTIYYGDYTTSESLALPVAAAINAVPNFTATTDGSGTVTATKQIGSTDDQIIQISHDGPDAFVLPTVFTQISGGDVAQVVTPTLSLTDPIGDTAYAVSLTGLGTEGGTIDSATIAGAIRDQLGAQTAVTNNWTVSGAGADVVWTTKAVNNPALTTTPETNGRSVAGEWGMTVSSFGDTGTTPAQLPNQTALETQDGIDAVYSTESNLLIGFRDGSTLPFNFGGMTALQAHDQVRNALLPISSLRVENSIAADNSLSFTIQSLDTSATGQAITSATFNPSVEYTFNGNTGVRNMNTTTRVVPESDFNIERQVQANTNADRPWPAGEFNEGQIYPVYCNGNRVFAGDLSFQMWNITDMMPGPYQAYIERQHFHVTPTKDTEHVAEVHLHATGQQYTDTNEIDTTTTNQFLDVPVEISNIVNSPVNFPALGQAGSMTDDSNYSFNLDQDYKVDVRETGRFFSIRIGDNSDDFWRLATFSLEVGKGGTR